MPDPAEQLARIYQAGFDIEQFDRYPQALGVVRDQCIALFEATPNGLSMIGSPGRRMGEVMGVLVEKEGRKVFQPKQVIVEATPELLEKLKSFERDLKDLLSPVAYLIGADPFLLAAPPQIPPPPLPATSSPQLVVHWQSPH